MALETDVRVIAATNGGSTKRRGPAGAADALGINASTLRSRMRKHGIRSPGR